MRTLSLSTFIFSLSLALVAACDDPPDERPPLGDTEFESASGQNGGNRSAEPPATAGADEDSKGEERAVEEADIYRFVGERLYVLNQYRGLFVFDVSNPERRSISPIRPSCERSSVRSSRARATSFTPPPTSS